MIIQQAYRFELRPRKRTQTLLARHAGTARFAWNWGLARRLDALARGERVPRAIAQHRELNASKGSDFPWMYEVSKAAPQEALRDLDRGFANWWAGRANKPRFKKKGVHDAFRLTGSIRVLPRAVQLPRLGRIRTKEPTGKMQGRILSATVSREADRWYVSLSVERERPEPVTPPGSPVGIDLGLTTFAVTSEGTSLEAPRALQRSLQLLTRRDRQVSRKQRGSKNRRKAKMQRARLHRRIRNQRRDFLHQATTELAKTKPVLVVEEWCTESKPWAPGTPLRMRPVWPGAGPRSECDSQPEAVGYREFPGK